MFSKIFPKIHTEGYKFIVIAVFITIIFLIDRLSKLYVINLYEDISNQQIFLTSFLNVYLIWNEGIAFGLLSFASEEVYNYLTFLIILINVLIIYILFKLNDIRKYYFLIILGGSLGNLFDRLIYRAVPDFIDFHIGNFHWFIFNPADIFITLGVICLILDEFFSFSLSVLIYLKFIFATWRPIGLKAKGVSGILNFFKILPIGCIFAFLAISISDLILTIRTPIYKN